MVREEKRFTKMTFRGRGISFQMNNHNQQKCEIYNLHPLSIKSAGRVEIALYCLVDSIFSSCKYRLSTLHLSWNKLGINAFAITISISFKIRLSKSSCVVSGVTSI